MSNYGDCRPVPRGEKACAGSEMQATENILDAFDDLLAVQCSDGTWDSDPYMHGMANGMILMRSLVSGETPIFLESSQIRKGAQEEYEAAVGENDGFLLMAAALDRGGEVARIASMLAEALMPSMPTPREMPTMDDRIEEMTDAQLIAETQRLEEEIYAAASRGADDEEMYLLVTLIEQFEHEAMSRGLTAPDTGAALSRGRSSYRQFGNPGDGTFYRSRRGRKGLLIDPNKTRPDSRFVGEDGGARFDRQTHYEKGTRRFLPRSRG